MLLQQQQHQADEQMGNNDATETAAEHTAPAVPAPAPAPAAAPAAALAAGDDGVGSGVPAAETEARELTILGRKHESRLVLPFEPWQDYAAESSLCRLVHYFVRTFEYLSIRRLLPFLNICVTSMWSNPSWQRPVMKGLVCSWTSHEWGHSFFQLLLALRKYCCLM